MSIMEMRQQEDFFREGFIPGPDEDDAAFMHRVHYCLGLRRELEFDLPPPEILEEAFVITQPLFGISPSWIPLNFSNHQLPFWIGGCAWIFQKTEDSPTGAFIQLRKSLRKRSSLMFYTRSELLAHEIAHIGRMAFQEPKYEEVFAYMTSPSSFRRWLGPLFSQNWEMMIFMALVIFVMMADICALWWGGWPSYVAVFPLKWIPLAWVGWLLGKLALKQMKIRKLKKRYPVEFLYCLTDAEIDAFAKLTDEQVKTYAERQVCPRWSMLRHLQSIKRMTG
jgi:hypothetical protein